MVKAIPHTQYSRFPKGPSSPVILKLGWAKSFQGGHEYSFLVFVFVFFTFREFPSILWPYFIYTSVTWLMTNLEKNETKVTTFSCKFLLEI